MRRTYIVSAAPYSICAGAESEVEAETPGKAKLEIWRSIERLYTGMRFVDLRARLKR